MAHPAYGTMPDSTAPWVPWVVVGAVSIPLCTASDARVGGWRLAVKKGDFCRVNKASFEGSVEVRPRGST